MSTIDDVSQRSHGSGQSSAKDVAMREKLPHATLAKPLKVITNMQIFLYVQLRCSEIFLVEL